MGYEINYFLKGLKLQSRGKYVENLAENWVKYNAFQNLNGYSPPKVPTSPSFLKFLIILYCNSRSMCTVNEQKTAIQATWCCHRHLSKTKVPTLKTTENHQRLSDGALSFISGKIMKKNSFVVTIVVKPYLLWLYPILEMGCIMMDTLLWPFFTIYISKNRPKKDSRKIVAQILNRKFYTKE